MFDLDKWNEIFSTIKKHKTRTLLTCFGVFWGILMLTLMLGAGTGLENGVVQGFDVAKNAIFIWSRRTSIPHEGLQPGRYISFRNADVEAIRAQVPELDALAPRNSLGGDFTINYKQKASAFNVYGDYPDIFKIRPMTMLQGRFLNDYDIEKHRKIAVIGDQVQKQLFEEGEDPIGKFIRIKKVYFRVVGIFRAKGDSEDIIEESKTIYIPHTAMQRAFSQGDRVYWFGFAPKLGIPSKKVENKIKGILMKRHKVHPDDAKAIGSANVEEEFKQVQGLFGGIRILSWFVSIGTIFAGIIGVSNIMLIIVKERTKEIGIRKALGATPWSIVSLIIQESIVITAFAGYLGLLCGVGIISWVDYLLKETGSDGGMFANPQVDLTTVISAVIVLVITGALAGLIPATKAARVNPVKALKDE